jgi:hypothetical protein
MDATIAVVKLIMAQERPHDEEIADHIDPTAS